MLYNNVELKILIKGKPITEYTHRGLTYVEGRESSEYELELKNNHSTRVEVIISVDGLSIIDGKFAGPESTGYVLNAYQKAVIPGWMVDQGTAAKFKFGAKEGSYSTGVSGGSSANNGVIGMMVYSEKQKPAPYVPLQQYFGYYNPYGSGGYVSGSTSAINNIAWQTQNTSSVMRGHTKSATPTESLSAGREEKTAGGMVYPPASINMADHSYVAASPFNVFNIATYYSGNSASDDNAKGFDIQEQSVQNLGTEFGDATKFDTTNVTFERKDMIGMCVIYYDSARGLRSRGVEIQTKRNTKPTPDAFPAMAQGCVPPKNWKK